MLSNIFFVTAQRLLMSLIILCCMSLHAAEQPAPTTTTTQTALSKNDIIDTIHKIVQSIPKIHPQVSLDMDALLSEDVSILSESHFIDIIEKIFIFAKQLLTSEQSTTLKKIQNGLKNKLKTYTACGSSFTIKPNVAVLGSIFSPRFEVTYKDPRGHVKRRKYQASIKTFGINLEFALRPSLIYFVGDVNYFDSNKTLDLGIGIELTPTVAKFPYIWQKLITVGRHIINDHIDRINLANDWTAFTALANFTITYCPFKNARGGLMILSAPLGLTLNAGPAIIGGGQLIPLDAHSHSLASIASSEF